MAISFVGKSVITSAGTSGTENVSSTLDAGSIATGDLLVMQVTWTSTTNEDPGVSDTTFTWTEVADLHSNDSYDNNHSVSWAVADGTTPPANFTVNGPTVSGRGFTASLLVFRGVDTTTPMDSAATTTTEINGSDVDPPAITPTTDDAWVVVLTSSSNNGAYTHSSGPTGYTLINEAVGNTGTYDVSAFAFYKSGMTGGVSEDPDLVSCSGSSNTNSSSAFTLCLRPASSGHSLTANGIKSTGVVGKPAITQVHALTASGTKSTGTVGKPALTQVHALTASGVKSEGIVGKPEADTTHVLTANGVKSEGIVGKPAITQVHALTAAGTKSQSTVGAPALTQVHDLTASGLESEGITGKPALTQVHALSADGVKSTGTVGAPNLTESNDLTANGIKSQGTVGSPALTQVHALTASGVTSTGRVAAPALTQHHELTPAGVKSTGVVGAPSLTESNDLTANGVKSQATVGAPALTQVHVLTPAGVKSEGIVGKPVLTGPGEHALTALGIKSTIIVGSPALTQVHVLTATGVHATGVVGSPSLTSDQPFTPSGGFGYGYAVQPVGDTRWEGVRQARERAREAFRDLPATRVAKRKKAAQHAENAVVEVAKKVREQAPQTDAPVPAFDPILDQLQLLLADLAGLMEQERIAAEEARAAAEMWAMIDRELAAMQAEEEELMVVMALSL